MAAAPAHRGSSPTLGHLRAAGLLYPYWDDSYGFRAVGVRHDTLNGRPATTVFYQRGSQRVGYTIVSGSSLHDGAPAHGIVSSGVAVRALYTHGMRVVTWLRHGHSCVLAGRNVPFSVLISLAASDT
jgi:hypothetical protein